MRWHDIYINAAAASLGRKEETRLAVQEGRYDARESAANGYLAVRVAAHRAPVEMAVEAATEALKRADVDTDDFTLVAHASIGGQGLEHFAPASYIQSQTVGGQAMAIEVKQFSNGGLASIEVGAAYLMAKSLPTAALLTSSDKFTLPTYDRYRSDRGMVFGDGATALVLCRGSGVARLLSTAIISDGTYGAVYIGDETWDSGSGVADKPLNLRARREQYLANNAALLMEVVRSTTTRQQQVVAIALADAGLASSDISRWIFLNNGLTHVDSEFRGSLGIDESRTMWRWGREVGHLGAGDQVAGLTNLLETRAVRSGDRVALCSMGMGFSYGCVIVEILAVPHWTNTTD